MKVMHFLNLIVLLLFGILRISFCIEIRKLQNATALGQTQISDASERIVGGEEAKVHEFPWLVRIQRKSTGGLRCGGTIIDHDLILTAAHCIENAKEDAKNFQILAGAHDMNAKEDARQIRNIKRINPHKGYSGNTFQNDICVIKLESNLTWSTAVKPALLSNENSTISNNVTTAGWGNDEQGPVTRLRKVSVPIVSNSQCSIHYNSTGIKIVDSMICAGTAGKDSCQGDSGGGLICSSNNNQTVVCGIVSFGAGCGLPGYPGVYTNVGSFRIWIAENNSGKSISLVYMIMLLSFSASISFTFVI